MSLSQKIDPRHPYILATAGMVYIGFGSTIYRFSFDEGLAIAVNDASVNPVRLEGPNGDFWVAKNSGGTGYLVGAYVSSGQCASPGFCLFAEDGSAYALGTMDPSYSWPGRSIIVGDDGGIYGWDAGFSLTGSNWTEYGKKLAFEFSSSPFGNGARGRVSETTVHSGSGSGRPYPSQLATRNNEWYDNGTKYYLTAFGFYKMSPVSGGGATVTYTSQDLSAMYRNSGDTGGGVLEPLEWTSPYSGTARAESNLFLSDAVVYYYKNGSISRIALDGVSSSETVVTNASIFYYTVANDELIYFTANGIYVKSLTTLSDPGTQVSDEFEIDYLVHLD